MNKQIILNRRNWIAAVMGLVLFFSIGLSANYSQNSMNTNGNLIVPDHSVEYADFTIPSGGTNPYIFLAAFGADGGKRQYTVFSTCTKNGGQGAQVSALFKVGTDGLKPNGKLRFIYGKKGENAGGVGVEGAGGGGGTGVLYRAPNSNTWEILLAAGGGGGAASNGLCGGASGKPGEAGTSGTGGNGTANGNGGSDGHGGTKGDPGSAGGGWKFPGEGYCNDVPNYTVEYSVTGDRTVHHAGGGYSGSGRAEQDGPLWNNWTGGAGGTTADQMINCSGNYNGGGYGFGGGGSGYGSGGGGGGYSGGGGGGWTGPSTGAAGGGGSYVNETYALTGTISKIKRGTTSNPQNGLVEYQFNENGPATMAVNTNLHLTASKDSRRLLTTGESHLSWQGDGNLVLYKSDKAVWSSKTNGHTNATLVFQTDGNLVIYDGKAIWASSTANNQKGGNGGRTLMLMPNGNLAILNADGAVIWQTNTGG